MCFQNIDCESEAVCSLRRFFTGVILGVIPLCLEGLRSHPPK